MAVSMCPHTFGHIQGVRFQRQLFIKIHLLQQMLKLMALDFASLMYAKHKDIEIFLMYRNRFGCSAEIICGFFFFLTVF